MTNLPGWSYGGHDPDGFMTADDLVSVLAHYAHASRAPVQEHTTVIAVEPRPSGGQQTNADGWTVVTDQGTWHGHDVVVATGHCMLPAVPPAAAHGARDLHEVTADTYRNPGELPDGGVLVVGASSTGSQIAEELARHGRDVVLAVGRHSRMPRRYRGADIFRWFERLGMLDDHIDDHPAPERAVRSPSMQLVGTPEHRSLDLATCHEAGVRITGRLVDLDGTRARFASTLPETVATSEARLHRVLDRIDAHIERCGLGPLVDAPDRPAAPHLGPAPDAIDLRAERINTIVWATGYRRRYPWLPEAALDARGEIRQRHGIGAMPGLYAVGLRFQRRRSSNFIGGVGADARYVVDHLTHRRTDRPTPHEEQAA
jgi:putative flavoprotein involved in K+ transport